VHVGNSGKKWAWPGHFLSSGGRTQFSSTYLLFIVFSNHWQLGGQNWQDASSTKKDYYFDMFYWTRYYCHGNTAGNKPALNNGFDLFSENPVVRFFPSFVSREKYWPIDIGLVKF